MGQDAEALLEIVGLLYEGLSAPDAWTGFLTRLGRQLGFDWATVTVHDTQSRRAEVASRIGVSPEIMDEWRALSDRNPRAPQVRRALAWSDSWIGATSLSKAPAYYRETEYCAWLQRIDAYHSLLAAVRLESQAASLSLARPRTAKPFSRSDAEFLRCILPHFQRAMGIRATNQMLAEICEAGKSALDKLDTGVAALDANGRVLMMNRQAEAILETSGGERLDRLIERAMKNRHRSSNAGGASTIDGSGRLDSVHVMVTPCQANRGALPIALAFLCNPAGKPASREATLRSLFGLTPAECRLAGLLHQGQELRTAAETMNVTSTTARFMLKRIFHKTGSHRQSHLIRLMSSLPGATGD